jgi:hypothetical protein
MMKKYSVFIFFVIIATSVTACTFGWSVEINSSSAITQFTQNEFNFLMKRFPKNEYCEGLLLEQVFYENGIEVIDSVKIIADTGKVFDYSWIETAESMCMRKNGELSAEGGIFRPVGIFINEVEIDPRHVQITNIAPTALSALGLKADVMPREALVDREYEHVVMIFLDGFGFEKSQYALEKGLIDFVSDSDQVLQAVSVYPPRTISGTAAAITGLLPKENGVDRGGIRKTDSTTIFDIASENGITSTAIEGDSLAFNLRNTNVVLSGDRDLNGGTDDNTYKNAMQVILGAMPRLLWIHFHGIDDYGHTYGPDDPILDEKIIEINGYLKQIYAALPEDTLIIYFADHGMHTVYEEGRLGNHGHLINEDMLIPVIIKTK